jgi:histidinol-phosphatase
MLAPAPRRYPADVPAPSDRDPDALRRFALALVDETDPIALAFAGGGLTISAKHDRTLVTQADTGVEEILRDRIAAAFPRHGVLGEELGTEPGDGETRWIIDPIDGTHNFVRGIPVWATLIAVERGGELIASVVSAPALHQRWHAAFGMGAATRDHAGERAIHVSAVRELGEAQVVYSTFARLDRDGLADALASITADAWRDRGFGDFWGYCLVAQGSAEAMFEVGPTLWDLAAPAFLVREAGGTFTAFDGSPSVAGPSALATNGLLHEVLRRRLSVASD